jgi:ABC-type multidrug transport system fused ATPase/permease subunit
MISLWRGRRLILAALVGASLCLAALAAVVAYCVQQVFDALVSSPTAFVVSPIILAILAATAAAGAALEIFKAWAAERLGLGYVADVRAALFASAMNASPELISQKGQGGLLLPFVGDLTAVKKWVSDGLVRLISATATAFLLLGLLVHEDQVLGLTAGAVVLIAAAAVVLLSAPLNAAIQETRARRGAVASFVSSSIRSAQTVRVFDRLVREAQRLERRADALMKAGLRLAAISGAMGAVVYAATVVLIGATVFVGALGVQSGTMSVGLVAAAISIAGLLSGAIRDLGVAFELWRRGKIAFAKIESALAAPRAVSRPASNRRIKQGSHVAFENVGVRGLFSGFSGEANPGDIVNVTGRSGVGKSSLLALVARARDPDAGRVRINGRDLRRASQSSLRQTVGYASEGIPLLRGSIAMNLRYRAPHATDADIASSIDMCGLSPVLAKFAEGANRRLSDGAPDLSAGEVQQVLIARAMLGAPPILILDDVDNRLDADAAEQIAAALSRYQGIVFLAGSTPALTRIANVDWAIEEGRVSVQDRPLPHFGASVSQPATTARAAGFP